MNGDSFIKLSPLVVSPLAVRSNRHQRRPETQLLAQAGDDLAVGDAGFCRFDDAGEDVFALAVGGPRQAV